MRHFMPYRRGESGAETYVFMINMTLANFCRNRLRQFMTGWSLEKNLHLSSLRETQAYVSRPIS